MMKLLMDRLNMSSAIWRHKSVNCACVEVNASKLFQQVIQGCVLVYLPEYQPLEKKG